MTREQIFEAVWGADHHGTRRTIDNFIAQLRGKLEDNPSGPRISSPYAASATGSAIEGYFL